MNNTKLIILVSQPLTKFNSKRFGLNTDPKNFTKEFWYMLPLINRNLSKKYLSNNHRIIRDNKIKNINSYIDLFKRLSKLKKGFFFINWAGTYKFSPILETILKIKGGIKIVRLFSDIQVKEKTFNLISRLYNFDKSWLLRRIIKSSYKKLLGYLIKPFLIKPKYYFIESQYQADTFKKNGIKNFFFINSFDYAEYLRINKKKNKKNDIVFIDSEIENSFEAQLLNIERKLFDKRKYWDCMEKIFSKIEGDFGNQKIKVAAHFRRSVKNIPINRKFYFDQTPYLIRDSKLVIAHNSTSIFWAILFEKPLILVNFENFQYLDIFNQIEFEFYQKELSLKIINVDLNYNFKLKKNFFKNSLLINKKKYNQFKKFYLQHERNDPKDKNGWKMMKDHLKKISKN